MTTTAYDVPGASRAFGGLGGVAVLVGLAVLTGCTAQDSAPASGGGHGQHSHHASPSPHPALDPTSSPGTMPADAAGARAALARLVVRRRPRGTEGYDRDAFGSSWVDTDGNGCNQRDDVLLRDSVPGTTSVAQQGACDHDVFAGTWHDPYTGKTLHFTDLKDLRQAEAIQIDHVVPLAEAWVSGARRWSPARREVFANDLDELLAVDGPTNMSKGDGDPASWRPRQGYQCTYARRWISVKTHYALEVDPPEVAARDQILGRCR